MHAAAHELRVPAASAATLWLCAALALGVHAGVLFAWRFAPKEPPLIEVEGDSMEVALVEFAPASPAPEAVPAPPEQPPPPLPAPSPPESIPPPKPPEMVLPEPPKATPAPKPTSIPKPAPKPARVVPRANPNVAPNASAPSTGGAANGAAKAAGKPAFIVRPAAAYPAESRAAGEQGVVVLRITVNAEGRATAVSVARGSGFPRLDRAAVEGGWRARVSNATAGAQFDAPVRFNLRD